MLLVCGPYFANYGTDQRLGSSGLTSSTVWACLPLCARSRVPKCRPLPVFALITQVLQLFLSCSSRDPTISDSPFSPGCGHRGPVFRRVPHLGFNALWLLS